MFVKNRFEMGNFYVFIIKSMGNQKYSGEYIGAENGTMTFRQFSTFNGSEHYTVFGDDPYSSKAYLKPDEILGEIEINR